MRYRWLALGMLAIFFLSKSPAEKSAASSLPTAETPSQDLLPLKNLTIRSDRTHGPVVLPDSPAFRGIDRVRIRFLGSPSYFVGILVSGRNRSGQQIHHGLFDQGPINEVLSEAFWKKPVLIHIDGIAEFGKKRYLIIEELPQKTLVRVPLEKALSVLFAQIGNRKDLVWGAN
ncbi:MAG: hypothetical protein ACYC9S_07220 [Leptospirales bacterium]